jgi:hypothetical protein
LTLPRYNQRIEGLTMRFCLSYAALASALLFSSSVQAYPVRVQVVDVAGEGLPKILVIARSLERPEGDRELSDANGRILPFDLKAGVYQLIAIDPYGTWPTTVQEVIVGGEPLDLQIELPVPATERDGELVPQIEVPIRVLNTAGQPVPNAIVLGRDPEAKSVRFYRTDRQGNVTPRLDVNGEYVVVFHVGKVYTERVDIRYRWNACDDLQCIRRQLDNIKPVESRTFRLK